MSEMKTSEALDIAAGIIEQRGWTTGSWNNTKKTAPVCIEGGIAAALGIPVDLGSFDGEGEYGRFVSCPAYAAVKEYLGVDALYHWNDEREAVDGGYRRAHTQAEVVEVLRATAAVERAKEEILVAVTQ